MKLVLLGLFLLSCKKDGNVVNNYPKPNTTVVQEDFEGYYYLEEGGYIDLDNDSSGLIDVISSKLNYKNTDNSSVAEISITGTNLLITSNKVFTTVTVLTSAIASFFRGNIQTSPNYQTNLTTAVGYTYTNQFIISKNDKGLLQIQHKIWQKKDDDVFLVYDSTISEK